MSILHKRIFYGRWRGGGGGAAAPAGLLLDLISATPTAALSTRKLRTDYAGSAIRVRRSSDNAELDIGFSGNDLDTVALLAHCGAGDGFVVTWYDQSGNARDFTNATAGQQPHIVASGVVIVDINSKPSVYFDTTFEHLASGIALSTIMSATAYTVIHGTRPASGAAAADSARALTGDSAAYFWHSFGVTGGDKIHMGHYDTAAKSVTFAVTYPSTHVFASRYDGTTIKGYMDGGAAASILAGSVGLATGTIKLGFGSVEYLEGYNTDILYFADDISDADLNLIGADLADYAGTSWTAVS